MGAYKRENCVSGHQEEELPGKIVKAFIACLWSFLVSATGGLLLGYWEYAYEVTSSQLWMVPSGLILLITPIFVWFALIVSEILRRSSTDDDHTKTSQPFTIHGSVDADDAERCLGQVPV